MADRSREMPLIRYTMALVLLIIVLAAMVLSAIVYQNRRYDQLSARANDYHLRAAGTAADALQNLSWIENLLITRPTGSYASKRDVITYYQLFAQSIEALLALEAARGPGDNGELVERLQQQWHAFQSGTRGLEENQAQALRAFRRYGPALRLTLRQLQRQHAIAHEDLSAELTREQLTGALTIGILFFAALTIGAVFGRRTLRLIRQTVDRRLQAERALEDYRDQLEEKVALRTVELESAVKELEAFSYSLSHDLRAPLRAIDGFGQALLEDYDDALDATGKNYLGRMRGAAQQMARLIDDMLRLSRISRVPFQPVAVDLGPMARDILANLCSSAPSRRVQIDIAESLPCRGDAGLLNIALENLLGNAWKYTGKTQNAYIRFDAEHRDGETVFRVSDNGVGFDMQFSGKLFGAFQRLHRKEEFDGTGIGLATVARIIHRHGGRVWAEAEVGKGAVFYFTLGAATGSS